MSMFIDAQRLASNQTATQIPTGSHQLDELTGGIRAQTMFLFYGEDELIDTLYMHLLANSLKPTLQEPRPEAVYVICGNYRVEHIMMDTEQLTSLLEATGQSAEDALKRVRVLVASSADQQANLTAELNRVISESQSTRLVLVKGIYKLGRDDARKMHRQRVGEEVQRSIAAMKSICASAGVPLVASAREKAGKRMPMPEASDYLNHLAGVIIYLRRRERGAAYNRAYVLKSPITTPRSREYSYEDERTMGRTTPPIRMSFEDLLARLRSEYREALVNPGRREAFDRLTEAWSAELGAITYAESLSLMDLILLTGLVEDRRISEELSGRLAEMEGRIEKLEQR
jgi:KaiC/GvpD/RAD55 family RecA-like ATPase